ncbi:MAG: F0F1 ATP synthase subunit alpha [Clostridia bacterium]|nr:F0F1 ATP synthase subunit alpha [Clostridia bacterium]
MADLIVTSARVLSEEKKRAVAESLGVSLDAVTFTVDEALIGGIVISDGEKVLDASVRRRVSDAAMQAELHLTNAPLEHILSSLKEEFSHLPKAEITAAGIVRSAVDGVVFADGLSRAKVGELLLVAGKYFAMVMNLERDRIGAILLTGMNRVRSGDEVRLTGKIVTVPVGEALLGRVVGPLGDPIDGLGRITTDRFRPAETPAPAILDRAKVSEPLYTGIKAVDAIVPIGKGQRELIIGDRQTGKTSLALDAILNQKGKNVYCIYVAIGQKTTTVADVVNALKKGDALSYTTVVAANASDSAPLQYVAPYAATAMAEELMYAGKDVLIVYDDLSKHAVAYRTISLLLRRPAGREAFPGDVFYIHSRLLERSAKLAPRLGGGSLTALPIIETLGSDISSYIPTNVISITDGQIFLESGLFHAGIRPAVNVGLSVSRVGGNAQPKAMRSVVKGLKLDLARYREMAVFTEFGADVDEDTKSVLDRGAKLTQMLIQRQGAPYPMAEEVAEIYAMSDESFRHVEKEKIGATLARLLEHIRANHPEILSSIEESGELSESDKAALDRAIAEVLA